MTTSSEPSEELEFSDSEPTGVEDAHVPNDRGHDASAKDATGEPSEASVAKELVARAISKTVAEQALPNGSEVPEELTEAYRGPALQDHVSSEKGGR